MKHRLLTGLLLGSISLCALEAGPSAAAGTACANLSALTIPNVTVNAATVVGAGAFTAPGSQAPMTLPAFCRVEATARPTSDSEIKFEV